MAGFQVITEGCKGRKGIISIHYERWPTEICTLPSLIRHPWRSSEKQGQTQSCASGVSWRTPGRREYHRASTLDSRRGLSTSDLPAASRSRMNSTASRVPRTTGLPARISGSITIRSGQDISIHGFLAERRGFEPPVEVSPYDGLANRCFRPLSHLSARL